MTVKFFAAGHRMSQHGEKFIWPFENLRDGVDESLIITGLMPFHRRLDRGQDVRGAAVFGKEDLDARACGFRCFNKDKLVFVRNDHRLVPEKTGNAAES